MNCELVKKKERKLRRFKCRCGYERYVADDVVIAICSVCLKKMNEVF